MNRLQVNNFLNAALAIAHSGQVGMKDQGNGHQSVLKRTYLTMFHGEAFNYRALIISVAIVAM